MVIVLHREYTHRHHHRHHNCHHRRHHHEIEIPTPQVIVLHREYTQGGSIGVTLAGGADYESKEITVSQDADVVMI